MGVFSELATGLAPQWINAILIVRDYRTIPNRRQELGPDVWTTCMRVMCTRLYRRATHPHLRGFAQETAYAAPERLRPHPHLQNRDRIGHRGVGGAPHHEALALLARVEKDVHAPRGVVRLREQTIAYAQRTRSVRARGMDARRACAQCARVGPGRGPARHVARRGHQGGAFADSRAPDATWW